MFSCSVVSRNVVNLALECELSCAVPNDFGEQGRLLPYPLSCKLRGTLSEARMIAAADTADTVLSEKHEAPQQPGASAIPSFTLQAYPMTA